MVLFQRQHKKDTAPLPQKSEVWVKPVFELTIKQWGIPKILRAGVGEFVKHVVT